MLLRYVFSAFLIFGTLSGTAVNARGLLEQLTEAALPSATAKKEYKPGALSEDAALELYSKEQKKLTFDACLDQFPARRAVSLTIVPDGMKPLALCSDNFAVIYSQTSKTPLVVVERLNAFQLLDAKGEERTNQFYADPRVPKKGRAELSDYRSQEPPVDRGHLAPAADAPNQRAMAQSFALSNMVPQSPESNRKSWSDVEKATRKFAHRAGGDVFVFSGPLFDAGHATVGRNKVWKPTRLFKLVYDEKSGRAWAHILKNDSDKVGKPVDYATFKRETGLNLLEGIRITGTAAHL